MDVLSLWNVARKWFLPRLRNSCLKELSEASKCQPANINVRYGASRNKVGVVWTGQTLLRTMHGVSAHRQEKSYGVDGDVGFE